MKSTNIIVRLLSLGGILADVEKGAYQLPDFQRGFEWSTSDIEEMLVTAFMSWPAGSLLLLEGNSPGFLTKPFSRAPGASSEDVRYLVLDGQQRLTALYFAIYDRGDTVYFIDARRLRETGDLEDCIKAETRRRWRQLYGSSEQQAEAQIIPCSALKNPTSYFVWRDEVMECSSRPRELRDLLTSIYQHFLSPIHSYEFPAVILEERSQPGPIARIFERVNRLGMKLNTFDLMVARTYSGSWNLRERWRDFELNFPDAASFYLGDGMAALQVIAMRVAGDVRQAAVLELSRETVQGEWDASLAGLAKAALYFQEAFGARSKRDLAYESIAILAAALFATGFDDLGDLEPFVWSRSFGRLYDVAANTRVVSDYKRFVRAGRMTQELRSADLSQEDLLLAGKQGGKALSNSLELLVRGRIAKFGLYADDLVRVSIFSADIESDFVGAASPSARVLSAGFMPRLYGKAASRGQLNQLLAVSDQIDPYLEANFLPPSSVIVSMLSKGEWKQILASRAESVLNYLNQRGVILQEQDRTRLDF